jgi:NTP pyrophosphatase (non-canonical NTP hydrolase)
MMPTDRQDLTDSAKPEKPATDSAADIRPAAEEAPGVSFGEFQRLIHRMYYEKDVNRGIPGTFMWFMEEVGELSTALRECGDPRSSPADEDHWRQRRHNLQQEFADVLAWLATMANVAQIDLNLAIQEKYGSGCPGCQAFLCQCPDSEKP